MRRQKVKKREPSTWPGPENPDPKKGQWAWYDGHQVSLQWHAKYLWWPKYLDGAWHLAKDWRRCWNHSGDWIEYSWLPMIGHICTRF